MACNEHVESLVTNTNGDIFHIFHVNFQVKILIHVKLKLKPSNEAKSSNCNFKINNNWPVHKYWKVYKQYRTDGRPICLH